MIIKNEFMALGFSERIRLVLRTGIYLNELLYPTFRLHCYSVSDFYVEVKIILETGDVESIRVISSEDAEKFTVDIFDFSLYDTSK